MDEATIRSVRKALAEALSRARLQLAMAREDVEALEIALGHRELPEVHAQVVPEGFVPTATAAASLGISKDAVLQRARRGAKRGIKLTRGSRVYVHLPSLL